MRREVDIRKTVSMLAVIGGLQILALLVLLIYASFVAAGRALDQSGTMEVILCILAILSSVLMLFNLPLVVRLYRQNEMLSKAISNVETLNKTLRAQRHDFLNHLQVVYSLIEMEEYADVSDYIERVYKDVQAVTAVLKTDHAPINAIIQAKSNMCRSRDIAVEMDVHTRLTDIPIPAWELCRVIGNIIDNAITALEKQDGEKKLIITMTESLTKYFISIGNNGPAIEPALWKRIFEPGFSTKSEDGHGFGLAICREIMEKGGGSLRVFSDEKQTVFEGTLPKMVQENTH